MFEEGIQLIDMIYLKKNYKCRPPSCLASGGLTFECKISCLLWLMLKFRTHSKLYNGGYMDMVHKIETVFTKATCSKQIHEAVLLVENLKGDFSVNFGYGGKSIDSPLLMASVTKLFTTAWIWKKVEIFNRNSNHCIYFVLLLFEKFDKKYDECRTNFNLRNWTR